MLSCDLNCWWVWICGKEDLYFRIGEENDCFKKVMGDFVWVLKDINFYVEEGEVLGIIGKNGVGKFILLKIFLWVIFFIVGCICVWGCIVFLLEVGIGFYFEMIGWENIYMNGFIMGMIKVEIICKLDEIVVFVGVEKYIDILVKCYFLGMIVWLGFVIVVYLELEILVVDEVLVVGDVEF